MVPAIMVEEGDVLGKILEKTLTEIDLREKNQQTYRTHVTHLREEGHITGVWYGERTLGLLIDQNSGKPNVANHLKQADQLLQFALSRGNTQYKSKHVHAPNKLIYIPTDAPKKTSPDYQIVVNSWDYNITITAESGKHHPLYRFHNLIKGFF